MWNYIIRDKEQHREEENSDVSSVEEVVDIERQRETVNEAALGILSLDIPVEFSLNMSFTNLMEIPEMKRMEGFDQKTPHHLLTLDEHSGEAWTNGMRNSWIMSKPYRPYVLLALAMHDVGKAFCYQEEETGTEVRRHFVGHEEASKKIIGEVLSRDFGMDEEKIIFVQQLAGLSTNGLLKTYDACYLHKMIGDDEFYQRVRESLIGIKAQAALLNWDMPLEEKIRLVFEFNSADKRAVYSATAVYTDPKDLQLIEHRKKQVNFLEQCRDSMMRELSK